MAGPPLKPELRADAAFLLRTPMLPFDTLPAWADAGAGGLAGARAFLAELLARADVEEAVHVASPSLHAAIAVWRRDPESSAGRRAEPSLVKYAARMAGRATPFGLFSAVSVGALGRATALELAPRAAYGRRTRLDNDYLFALCDALARTPEARARLRFDVNTSLYAIAGRLRYAEARLRGTERSYHLVAVEPTPYLEATLARARGGARLADLAAALIADDPEVSLDEAAAYVDQLVDAQLLVPHLGVAITGPEPLDAVIAQLAAAGLDEPARILGEVRAALAAIDAAGPGNPPARYRAIAEALAPLPATPDPARLFQVDAVKPADATLSPRIAAEVARAIEWLRQASRPQEPALRDFLAAFRARWEHQEVPLARVLDEETGIGFESSHGPGSEGSPLLAGLPLGGAPARASRVPWTKVDAHLQARLHAALAAGADELVLDDADLAAMRSDAPPPLPDAMSAMIRLAGTPEQAAAGDVAILFEGASGPSGARLLGRFCHAAPALDAAVRAHLRAEEALRPDAVFAEVVHLNEGRIGNILCRPVLRDHEIVFLGLSGAPADRQLTVDDLLVSIHGDRIVLRSRRLGREVVPRLSTAHNFRLRSLVTYRFLCAIQHQGEAAAGWSWGALAQAPYLPRVRLGKVVLARQTWRLGTADLAGVTAAVRALDHKRAAAVPIADKRATIAGAVAALRTARRLPRFVVIADADNELPVDLDNPLLVQAFADELAGRDAVTIEELWPAPGATPVRGPEGTFASELVLTFVREAEATSGSPASRPNRRDAPRQRVAGPSAAGVRPIATPTVTRSFPPGSPWLYAKLYAGAATGDRVIRDALAPVARDALARGDATRWFFIRYQDDGGPHVRVRFHGAPERLLAAVAPALAAAVDPLRAEGAIWRVAYDTYDRELERYGGEGGIELCEQIFWYDSDAVAAMLDTYDGDPWGDLRWRLALRGSDRLLALLGLDPDARQRVFTSARDAIGREHGAGAPLWAAIGERYKPDRAGLEALVADEPALADDDPLAPGVAILARRDAAIAPAAAELVRRDAAGELSPPLAELAWSLVHMHCNRLLHASQRTQEMVLYDYLRRYHEARRARARGRG